MRDIERDGDQRSVGRTKIFQPAVMRQAGSEQPIHLLNLSVRGALGHAQNPPAERSFVAIRCMELRAQAQVGWVCGHRFGLAFVEMLEPGQVDRIAKARRGRA